MGGAAAGGRWGPTAGGGGGRREGLAVELALSLPRFWRLNLISRPFSEVELLEEIVALVVADDEGGEVDHLGNNIYIYI